MIIPWINNSTARGSGTNARQEMCVPGSSTTNWLSLHEMSKCRPRWSPQQVVWAYAACSAEDSPAFSFFGSLDLAVVTEGGRTAHENTIDDEQALPEVTWPQWERWACGDIAHLPQGSKTGGYELKMAFKYVSESQQKPVTIKRHAGRVMSTAGISSFMPESCNVRPCQVSAVCVGQISTNLFDSRFEWA